MPPVVLGIDTSSSWCSAALSRGSELYVRRAEVGNAHSQRILAMVDEVLGDAGIALVDCDAIAFSAGPGSFTGLRVGCAVAQGLAFGACLEVACIGTLDAIARAAAVADGWTAPTLLAAQDARMGDVYWALFEQVDGRLVALAGPALAPPSALRDSLRALRGDRPVAIGCGNAWAVHGAAMDGLVERVDERETADAADVAALGVLATLGRHLMPADRAAPLYVRNEVARTTVQRQADRAAFLG